MDLFFLLLSFCYYDSFHFNISNLFKIMFNTTVATSRAGTSYPFRNTWVNLLLLVFCFSFFSLVFSVVFGRPLLFLLSIFVLPVLLLFIDSTYHFGIFRLFLFCFLQYTKQMWQKIKSIIFMPDESNDIYDEV